VYAGSIPASASRMRKSPDWFGAFSFASSQCTGSGLGTPALTLSYLNNALAQSADGIRAQSRSN